MAWTVAPRKTNGLDRFLEKQASVIAFAQSQGWGDLVSIGETTDCFVFNFLSGDQVFWRPPTNTDNEQGINR
jgi:hypothetical protein